MSNTPVIILVEPQLGENIGFVARAMGNFGFTELRIVNPRDGWPNESARITATKARPIVEKAKIFKSFDKSVSDLSFLYASTARSRDCNKECVPLNNLKEDIREIPAGNIGIVFGPERSGLDNKIVTKCNKTLQIPTTKEVPSLNIAVSAGVICYELSKMELKPYKEQELATYENKMFFINFLEQSLEKSGFFKSEEKRQKMMQNLTNLFNRTPNFTSNEASTLLGAIKSLLEYSK